MNIHVQRTSRNIRLSTHRTHCHIIFNNYGHLKPEHTRQFYMQITANVINSENREQIFPLMDTGTLGNVLPRS